MSSPILDKKMGSEMIDVTNRRILWGNDRRPTNLLHDFNPNPIPGGS
jgi:hypothetical protein